MHRNRREISEKYEWNAKKKKTFEQPSAASRPCSMQQNDMWFHFATQLNEDGREKKATTTNANVILIVEKQRNYHWQIRTQKLIVW
jgi:hypothetical protein